MKKEKVSNIDPKDFDKKIRPQDDFYHFACGNWLRRNPIPKTETRWGSFSILRDKTRSQVKEIFDELLNKKSLKKGSARQQLRDFYLSGMDEKYIDSLGLSPLDDEVSDVEKISNMMDLIRMTAQMHKIGNDVFFNTFVDLDDKNNDKTVLLIHQSSLGLPGKEYYLSKKDKFVTIRKKYISYIFKMLKYSGVDGKEAKIASKNILDIEIKFARASMSAEEKRDVKKTYNKMTVAKLQELCPNIDWRVYLKEIGAKDVRHVIVGQPRYLKTLSSVIKNVSIKDWQYYIRFCLVSGSANLLPADIGKEYFAFYGKLLLGAKTMKPRWQRVYAVVDAGLTESIGAEYIAKHFSKNAGSLLKELISNIQEVFAERIKNLDWMSLKTKGLALKKLSGFRSKIGAPNKTRDYSKITISPKSYLRNSFNSVQFEFARNINKLGKPIDKEEWFMGAHVVNAYYWANQNEIVFPAGILQSPFFDEKGDIAINYGAIGAVIGHELTHGFDDNGKLFDSNGNLHDWWTKKDTELFKKRANILVKQYNNFIAVDDLNVNGKLTLGENIADLGGVVLGYYALKKYMEKHGSLSDVGGFTPEQRFFFGVVLFQRASASKETIRFITLCDPHALYYTRINGPLSNLEEFYEAFDVKKGDGMYKDPKNRAKIW